MGLVQNARVITIVEWVLLAVLAVAVIVSIIILTQLGQESYLSIFSRYTLPTDMESNFMAGFLAMFYTLWGCMILCHVISASILNAGVKQHNRCLLLSWIIFQSILVAAGLTFLAIGGNFKFYEIAWWLIALLFGGYIYRIASIHIIRRYYIKIGRVKS